MKRSKSITNCSSSQRSSPLRGGTIEFCWWFLGPQLSSRLSLLFVTEVWVCACCVSCIVYICCCCSEVKDVSCQIDDQ